MDVLDAAAAGAPLVAARPSLAETGVSSTTSKRLTFRFRSVPMAATTVAARALLRSRGAGEEEGERRVGEAKP
uniref:Pre-mRNA-splicing factor ATP-dependent RNA helicase n=1 Tax=Arundo donax TaxID=35708 RepID=A0A0A9GFY6_ARUDO